MEWISVKDRLPEEGQDCWIYTCSGEVMDGFFTNRCPDDENSPLGDFQYTKGFCIDEETGYYKMPKEIAYWMPYFTPEPPKQQA